MSGKLVSVAIFVFAAGAGLISIYLFTILISRPTPDAASHSASSDNASANPEVIQKSAYDRKGWRSYRDPLGYKFQYPPEWKVDRASAEWDPTLLGQEVYLRPKDIPYGPPPLLQIDVRAATPEDSNGECSLECSEVFFNGKKAIKVVSRYGGHTDDTYSFVYNFMVYTVWYQPWLAEYGITEDQAKAVLTSFTIDDR